MLNPIKQEMEDRLATLAGPPTQARAANFYLPDFIDIVANRGDDRQPMGWVAGQSLPNWGPVVNAWRGCVFRRRLCERRCVHGPVRLCAPQTFASHRTRRQHPPCAHLRAPSC